VTNQPAIAVLIDADNAALETLDKVLGKLDQRGIITVRRAYGNWFKPTLRKWDAGLTSRGIRAVQQSDPVKHKNATDLALVIDAVDLHHTLRPDVFAIVSSDSDYTPLATYLRERGHQVLGFGRPDAPASFQAACTTYVGLPAKVETRPKPEPKAPTLAELLATSITKNADKHGWARLNSVAQNMSQEHGQSAKDHGKATWSKVLKGLPEYELRNEGTTAVAVRLRQDG